MGHYVTLKCNVTGNPKPNIQWYHNGKLIEYDWLVTYEEPKLVIQTYEEKDKGVYQCVATNVAGEAQATALLSLRAKQYNDAPKNIKCLPLNASTFKVIFDGPANYRVWPKLTTNFLIRPNFLIQNILIGIIFGFSLSFMIFLVVSDYILCGK